MQFVDTLMSKYELQLSSEVDGVYYLKNSEKYLQFINPHKGTEYKYCIRADFPETFDRWSVAMFEEMFEEAEFEQVLSKLDDFFSNKHQIVSEEMEIQPELYGENFE